MVSFEYVDFWPQILLSRYLSASCTKRKYSLPDGVGESPVDGGVPIQDAVQVQGHGLGGHPGGLVVRQVMLVTGGIDHY